MQVWCASAANAGHWAFDLRRMVQRRHEIAQFHDTCVENHNTSVTHRVRRVCPPLPTPTASPTGTPNALIYSLYIRYNWQTCEFEDST